MPLRPEYPKEPYFTLPKPERFRLPSAASEDEARFAITTQ
jgi:hypothetical protein